MSCPTCGGITLFKGADGKTIYNGSGAPTLITANEGDFYIDTTAWEIYGPFTGGSWGSGTSLIGPAGATGATGNGIASIVWTSNSGGQPQGTQGTIDTYTITFTNATTATFVVTNGADGANGADANSQYGKTLFVDAVYGNNSTGTRERFDLPYLTYAAALADAVSGDTIYFRPGDYSGSVVLKDGVNIELAEGATIRGVVTDNAVAVVCRIGGSGVIYNASGKGLSITAPDSDVKVTLDKIFSTDVHIEVRPGVANIANVEVTVKSLEGLTTNYAVTAGGAANVTVNVLEKIQTANTANVTIFEHRQSFKGKLVINCPRIFIGNSTDPLAGQLYADFESSSAARVYLNLGEVVSSYNFSPASEEYGMITRNGDAIVRIKVDSLYSITRPGIVTRNATSGKTFFEGNITCENIYCVNNASTSKLIIKNSTLHRSSGGTDDNEVMFLGSAAIVGAQADNIYTELRNVNIVKTSSGTDTAEIVMQSGVNSKAVLLDVNCITIGVRPAADFNGLGAGQGKMYFKNVHSTASALGANITQLEAPSNGYDGAQSNLTTVDIVD